MVQKQIRRSDQEWMELITECRASGLSDRDWCLERSIPISTFYNRVTHLRKKACEIPVTMSHARQLPQQVVPVTILNQPVMQRDENNVTPTCQPAVTLYVNGWRLEINNHADAEVILNTVSALQQLC